TFKGDWWWWSWDVERDDGARAARRPPVVANRMDDVENVGGGQGIVGAGEMIRRNAENVAARLEMQAARLEAQVEQMFDGLDDVDGAEDVPFDELVGMQGPVFHLVENAFTVSLRFVYLGIGSAAATFYTYSIYVKSLPINASVSEVEEEFKTFGKIRPNGIQQGGGFCFGFVEFESLESVKSALKVVETLLSTTVN
ncbi:hypothetical protein IFM89_035817, partial [Coptis chinensis]